MIIQCFLCKALEEGRDEDALKITNKNRAVAGFVNATDKRAILESGEDAYIDCRFQYRYRLQPREGFTLLHYAMLYNHVNMMKELIQNGAGMLNNTHTSYCTYTEHIYTLGGPTHVW